MKTVILLIALIALVMIGCTDAKNTRHVLEAQGFTNVQTTGYKLFGCSESDIRHTGFTATAPNGSQVNGVVCQGLFFKGATVRFK